MTLMTKVHAVNYLLEGSSQEPFPLLLTLWLVNFKNHYIHKHWPTLTILNFCCGCDKSTYVIDLSDFVTNFALLAVIVVFLNAMKSSSIVDLRLLFALYAISIFHFKELKPKI